MPSVKIPNGSGGWIKIPTVKGDTGNGIVSVIRTSGTGLAGSTDTYTITYSDATTSTYTVVNGTDGNGAGDMFKSAYDTNNDGIVNAADSVPWTGVTDPPSTYTPSSHAHGNITNDGKIGSTADLMVCTTTAGAVTTKTVADTLTLLGLSGAAKIETTSYTGTGTSGSGNPKSLVFTGTAYLVVIKGSNGYVGIYLPQSLTTSYVTHGGMIIKNNSTSTSASTYAKISADGKTLYWYDTTDDGYQLNTSGQTYSVVVIAL